jgi:hypothetical protein
MIVRDSHFLLSNFPAMFSIRFSVLHGACRIRLSAFQIKNKRQRNSQKRVRKLYPLPHSLKRKYKSGSALKIPAGDGLTARVVMINTRRQRVIQLTETGNYSEVFRLNKKEVDYNLENGTVVCSN